MASTISIIGLEGSVGRIRTANGTAGCPDTASGLCGTACDEPDIGGVCTSGTDSGVTVNVIVGRRVDVGVGEAAGLGVVAWTTRVAVPVCVGTAVTVAVTVGLGVSVALRVAVGVGE